MRNSEVFKILAPYAEKLECSDSFYGIRMGHYCNSRQVGYIELDFDFNRIGQFERKINDIKRILSDNSPFDIYYLNTYDPEMKRTFSVIHLFLGDDLKLDEELIKDGWTKQTSETTRITTNSDRFD